MSTFSTSRRCIRPPTTAVQRASGFTLVEVVVALTIIAVIAGIAIPIATGVRDERQAREPLRELALLVQELRQRAIGEGRAYQIVFESSGFHGLPFIHPYRTRSEQLQQIRELTTGEAEAAIQRSGIERQEIDRAELIREETLIGTPERGPVFVRSYPLPDAVRCEVLFWGEGEWEVLELEDLRRWVFQPNGMLRPARVRFQNRSASFEAWFDPLTGEIQQERSHVD